MNTFDVKVVRLPSLYHPAADILEAMYNWCIQNTGVCKCDIPLEDMIPRTKPFTERFTAAHRACRGLPTFTFESELDAIAFRLMFSEYL